MNQSLTIKVSLEEVEQIVLNYCKKKFNDDTLKIKSNIENIRYYKGDSSTIMEAHSTNIKQNFNVERKIKISNIDIKNIFSVHFANIGYEIADYNLIFGKSDDIELLFVVAELEEQKQKSIGGR